MKDKAFRYVFILSPLLAVVLMVITSRKTDESASSFVGYSQSCCQEGDTLYVVTAKGDTVRLDVSRLEGER